MVELRTATLDGKQITYSSESIFEVQIGRYKGSYKTRWSFTGNLGRALMYYSGINIGRGYKKRLICRSMNKPMLARMV